MRDELAPIVQRAYDLNTVDEVLCRLCDTDGEVSAFKRVLGVEDQETQVSNTFTPELPLNPEFRPKVDHVAHAHRAVARYESWVASYPDEDRTPLAVRERALHLACLDLERLEGDTP